MSALYRKEADTYRMSDGNQMIIVPYDLAVSQLKEKLLALFPQQSDLEDPHGLEVMVEFPPDEKGWSRLSPLVGLMFTKQGNGNCYVEMKVRNAQSNQVIYRDDATFARDSSEYPEYREQLVQQMLDQFIHFQSRLNITN